LIVLQSWKLKKKEISRQRAIENRKNKSAAARMMVRESAVLETADIGRSGALDGRAGSSTDLDEEHPAIKDRLAETHEELLELTGEERYAAVLAEKTRAKKLDAFDRKVVDKLIEPGSWYCRKCGKVSLGENIHCEGYVRLKPGSNLWMNCGGSQLTEWGGYAKDPVSIKKVDGETIYKRNFVIAATEFADGRLQLSEMRQPQKKTRQLHGRLRN